MHVEVMSVDDAAKAVPRLATILVDAVASGAGVSFLHPLLQTDAEQFWLNQLPNVKTGKTFILVCRDSLRQIMGLVLLDRAWAPNQTHRAEVAKLLVHSDFRRQGVGSALMQHMEKLAQKIGLKMINFDAVAGSPSDQLYRMMGYHIVGTVPGYAYSGTGEKLDDVVFFYKTF